MTARVLALVALAACGDARAPDDKHHDEPAHAGDTAHGGTPHAEPALIRIAPDMMRDLRITTGVAQARAAGETVTALGELHVNEDAYAEVAAPISARVAKLLVRPGDRVTAGQPLAQLASPELGTARAEADAARVRLALARKTAERKQALAADRLIPEREQLEAAAQVAEAEAAAQVADAGLRKLSGGAPDALRLTSPIAGTVIERSAVLGQLADPAKTLFRVGDLSTLWLIAHVFERDAVRVPIGGRASASFAALPGKSFDAVIRAIGHEVDAASRTIAIRLDVANPDGVLRPGMSATARLALGEPGAASVIVVPAAAVQRVGATWAVFIPHGEGSFEARAIGRGRDLSGDVEVLSGLNAGEAFVLDGAFLLKAEADKARGGGHDD